MSQMDSKFVGPVPEMYDTFMVPLLFQSYAQDMAARVAALAPEVVLETAAGSGVVTRALAPLLGPKARYVVTDLNPPMLDKAKARQGDDARIEWTAMDAQDLALDDSSFDAVCCQFGAMFFPDRRLGFSEARRVLKPGAPFVFSVWDCLDQNDIPATVWQGVTDHYPDNPPQFFRRVPHGYFVPSEIKSDLEAAGFNKIAIELVTKESRATTARDAALALVMGTPLRMEILARDPGGLDAVTDAAEAALRKRYGDGQVAGKIQALVVTATA
jgi:ubiquinone/menaquinone biosynthesis C-methylase UbiE